MVDSWLARFPVQVVVASEVRNRRLGCASYDASSQLDISIRPPGHPRSRSLVHRYFADDCQESHRAVCRDGGCAAGCVGGTVLTSAGDVASHDWSIGRRCPRLTIAQQLNYVKCSQTLRVGSHACETLTSMSSMPVSETVCAMQAQ
jgi:hypothetical protein